MYWLDTTILAILGVGAVFGALSGLLMQLARLVGFAVALYAAIACNDGASALVQRSFVQDADPLVARIVAYVVVFLVVYLSIFLTTVALERGMKAVKLQVVNRVLGALLGAAKLGLLLGALFLGVRHYPSDATREMMRRSTLAPVLAQGAENLVVALAAEYRDELRGGLDELGNTLRNAGDAPPEATEQEAP
jgi:uncharacterized membrane protein required for colicin V production